MSKSVSTYRFTCDHPALRAPVNAHLIVRPGAPMPISLVRNLSEAITETDIRAMVAAGLLEPVSLSPLALVP